jgi:hypothetical protein
MSRGLGILLIAGSIILFYYLLIRPFEFSVNFQAKTQPGDLIETIRIWDRSLDSAKIIEVDSFKMLKQEIKWSNRIYHYEWNFKTISDSITKVTIQISEPKNRFRNKILIPFTDLPIENTAKEIVGEFYRILNLHLKITNVKIIGKTELDSAFCVCSSVEADQIEKANGMMREYPLLTSFIADHNLSTKGVPRIYVHSWSHSIGKLKFDFCFPIEMTSTLPPVDYLSYKSFKRQQVLKAEYYGNYITSDRAWYELIHYAQENGYIVKGLPIEFFHNNPNMGVNESEWKADIYLPVDFDTDV